ncbi:MAG: di-heme-cytochrome C peroxidase, partial [Proteobacteria bacterium]|nr:di-heme-cytochrome C peroxidase [Pseudomonadota bacterium]
LPHVPDAPVRYPHLWDSPVTDYVQTNAVTHAPLVRNIGEVLGVYGDFWSPTGPGNLSSKLISVFDATLGQLLNQDIIPFGSSVNFGAPDGKGDGIVWCEKVLRLLKAPAWADIPALPPINVPLATLGKAVYQQAGCEGCHAVPGPQNATSRAWTAPNTKKAPLPSGKGSTPIPNQYQKVSLVAVDALTKNNRKFENTNRPCVAACKGRAEIRDHDVYTINFRGAPIDVTIYDAASVLSGPIGTDERFLANEIQHTLTLNPGDLWQNGLLTAIKADPFASTLIGADGKTIPSYASVGVAALQLTNGYWQSQGAQVSASNALNFSQKPQLYGQYLDAMNSGTAIAPPPMVPPLGYRARNLAGIWATAPYLHNASVPNLRQLLTPPAQRIKQFYIGSLVFDPQNVGFTYANPGNQTDTITLLDTSTPGSSNTGHAYGTDLTDDQKTQLIEYLKTLTSDGEYPTLGG